VSLEELLLRDELRRENLTPGEIERLREGIARRLHDAAVESNYPETRLEQAYHAILGCALVGLRASNLRPTNRPGHHIATLESLADTIGISPERVDYFQALRVLRNKELYTGSTHVTVHQAEEAIEEATGLTDELELWLGGMSTETH
jgi:hypothetical protein